MDEQEAQKEKSCGPIVSLSMKLRETKEERRLQNYEKYLSIWDKHETKVKKHFNEKDVVKYGSNVQ